MKLGITGPIAEVNFGDYSMLINNMYDLGKEHHYTLYYYHTEKITAFHKIVDLYLNDFKTELILVEINNHHKEKFIDKVKNKVRTLFDVKQNKQIYCPIDILGFTKEYNEIRVSIENLDLMIVNGGGYFNNLWHGWSRQNDLFSIIVPIIIANNLKKPIVFFANGFGPFDQSSEFYKSIFNGLDNTIFSCRDNLLSPGYMRSLGIGNESLKVLPDDLLVISENLITSSSAMILPFKNYILFESYLTVNQLKEMSNEIKTFANKMYDKLGLSIVFVPFQSGNGGEKQGEYLKSIIPNHRYHLYDINKDGIVNIFDLLKLVKHAKIVIGTRYHSLVLSLGLKTPVITILKKVTGDYRYYYNKNLGVLNMVFDNQNFDYTYFLKSDLNSVLAELPDSYNQIIKYQLGLLTNKSFSKQLSHLKNIRLKHIEEIVSSRK